MLSAAAAVEPNDDCTIGLSTGRLDIQVDQAAWPLDALCAFAARENPKRGFLIVSRVLGRHVPARPAAMRRAVRDLTARVPRELAGPVLVVGLAETAIALGQMLHEELLSATGRDDLFFLHSTRQIVDAPLLCRFEEPHSHASAHLVYRPQIGGFVPPRTLVIVDDEVSTGTTARNLADALVGCWPGIERIVVATLTDWSRGTRWPAGMSRPTEVVALLSGCLDWSPAPTTLDPRGFEVAARSLGRLERSVNYGRLGLRAPPVAAEPPLPPIGGPLRVVGTGEFLYLPFRLAERLEAAGHDVVVQATTRSPARVEAAMTQRLNFRDNYATGVANHLYNSAPGDGRETWLCHEPGAGDLDPDLVAALDAHVLGWPE